MSVSHMGVTWIFMTAMLQQPPMEEHGKCPHS